MQGRKSEYKKEMHQLICSLIADGHSLHQIAGTLQNEIKIPERHTVVKWLNKYADFAADYARADQERTEKLTDEIITIADDDSRDYEVDEQGRMQSRPERVRRDQLRIDSRKWIASKLLPKKYGDKTTIEHTGEIATTVNFITNSGEGSGPMGMETGNE